MTYVAEWAGALSDIQDAGQAVVFTRTRNIEDTATGLITPVTTTISGSAVRIRGTPSVYDKLKLIESTSPTLLFAASTFGDLPRIGDTTVWGVGMRVRDVEPVRPDGTTLIARIVVST